MRIVFAVIRNCVYLIRKDCLMHVQFLKKKKTNKKKKHTKKKKTTKKKKKNKQKNRGPTVL